MINLFLSVIVYHWYNFYLFIALLFFAQLIKNEWVNNNAIPNIILKVLMCVCYNCSFLNLSFRWEFLLRASPLAGQLQSLGFWYVTVCNCVYFPHILELYCLLNTNHLIRISNIYFRSYSSQILGLKILNNNKISAFLKSTIMLNFIWSIIWQFSMI